MEPTITPKDTKSPKLTLTATRFDIKMPLNFDPVLAERVVLFARFVAARLGTPTQTLRGTIRLGDPDGRFYVQMKKDNKESVAAFKEGVDEVQPGAVGVPR